MKRLENLVKKVTIYIVIFMLILSSITPATFAYTPEEVGNAVGGFAKHVVDTYGNDGKKIVGYRQRKGDKYDNKAQREASGKTYIGEPGHCRTDNPCWSPDSYNWNSPFIYFDCSSFATGCYHYVTGLIDSAYNSGSLGGNPSDMVGKFEKFKWDGSTSSLKTGDLIYYTSAYGSDGVNGHAWIYSGDNQTSENGSFHSKQSSKSSKGVYVWRITAAGANSITNLNTEFSGAGTGMGGSGIQGVTPKYSNFFFNGVPDGTYSISDSKTIFEIFINALGEIVNFLTGLITYLFRGVIIGLISVFDRLINNTIQSVSDAPATIKESGVRANDADDPISMDRYVTIEGLIFGDVDLFDINIFKVD